MPRNSKFIPKTELEKTVGILKAVGNHSRFQIVNILLKGECQTGKLVDKLGIGQSLTSQQLRILKTHGVLKSRREANKTYYAIANDHIRRIVETIKTEIM